MVFHYSTLIVRALLLLAMVSIPIETHAQAPATIAGIEGRTFDVSINSGSGVLASSGSLRFLPSSSTYDIVPLTSSVTPSMGQITSYIASGAAATLTVSDNIYGVSGTMVCSFSNATSGSFSLTVRSGPTVVGSQFGNFSMSQFDSPASVAGAVFDFSATSGGGSFAPSGSGRILPDAALHYQLQGSGAVSSSSGTYTYDRNHAYTARIGFTDTVAGNGYSSKFFFRTATTGTYTFLHSSGNPLSGYQTGTFTYNTPPTITGIANQSLAPGTATATLSFTIGDTQTQLSSLTLSKDSSNITLVPKNNIVIGGSGANRTVKVTPATGQSGVSTITLTVSDGNLAASTQFTVTVNLPPSISNLLDTSIQEDGSTGTLSFMVSDAVTPAGSLSVTAVSNNQSLVPNANLVPGGSGSNRTLTATPAANQSGSAMITVTVTDSGGLTASDTFILTVNPVNDPPTITTVPSLTTAPGVATPVIPFRIGDIDTPITSLVVTASSGNEALVSGANIILSGGGVDRTVMVKPTAGQTGSSTITLTVSDAVATTSTFFTLSVLPPELITKGATWKYLAPLSAAGAPAANWNMPAFSDAAWSSGAARIGYGGDGEVTAIPTTSGKPFTFYLRRKFTVTDAASISGLRFNLIRDDGAVIYLNGVEKWRSNMPEGVSIAYSTPARAVTGGVNEITWYSRDVMAAGLLNGENTIAVEVHQNDAASSDLGFDLEVIPLSYTPNTPPWISDINDVALAASGRTGGIAFAIGDAETAAGSLSVSAVSSNPAVIPQTNLLLGGSGGSNNITINAPVGGPGGSSLIRVTVSDGVNKSETAFVVTVQGAFTTAKLATWGDNDYGRLGNNTTIDSDNPVAPIFTGPLASKTPVDAATGEAHGIVLFTDGTLAAWGRNDDGQLGTGNTSGSLVPVPVPMAGALSGKTVTAVEAGRYHSIALCSDGTVACWGGGGYGELGNGATADSSVPVQVTRTGVLSGKTVIAVAAGDYHNLVLCSDGTLAAWGYNYDGSLGNGTTNSSRSPVAVSRTGPLQNRIVTAIAAGGDQCLVLCSDGTLAAWGDNYYGQLGDGSTTDRSFPVQVNNTGVLASRIPSSIAVGTYHCLTACNDGRIAAWGYNGSRQLGDGSSANRTVPVLVSDTSALTGRFAVSVTAGLYGSASVCTDGTAAEWGDTNTPLPATINLSNLYPGHSISSVSAGSFFKIAIAEPPSPAFKVTTLHHISAGDVFIGFPSREGVRYRIDWSDFLGAWAAWGTVTGTGGELITRLRGYGPVPRRFFRAVEVP